LASYAKILMKNIKKSMCDIEKYGYIAINLF